MSTQARSFAFRSSWWYVARLIAFRPGLYALSAAGIISFYLWPLVPGIFIRRIFDMLLNQTPLTNDTRATLWAFAGVLIGVALVRGVSTLAYPFGEKAAMLVADAVMRHNILRSILGRPGATPLPAGSSPGEAVSRLRDDMAHISVFMTWTADPIGQILAFGIAFVTLARIDLRITIFGFLPLLAILAFVNALNTRIRRYRKANQESIGQVTGLLGELFGAVQAVKVAGAEAQVVAHLQRASEVRRTAALRDQLLTNLINAFSFGATNIATGVLLILAAQSLQSGQITVGDFSLFASYLSWLATVMGMVGGYVTRYQQVGVSLQRAIELLQGEPGHLLVQHDADVRMRGALPALAVPTKNERDALQTLDVSGLTYRYPSSGQGIEGMNLRITRGQFVVITGRIGSGKSTMLRAMLGLLPPQAGELCWNGRQIGDLGAFMVPPRVAYTPQVPRLFSETLRDNLLMGVSAGAACLSATCHGWNMASKRGLGRVGYAFRAGRCSGRRRRGCLCARPICSSSTTFQARWMSKPSSCCGNGWPVSSQKSAVSS